MALTQFLRDDGFSVSRASDVQVQVYTSKGEYVKTLFSGKVEAGFHELQWRTGNLHTGMYMVKMMVNSKSVLSRTMLRL